MRFREGKPLAPLQAVGGVNGRRGTEVNFLPDPAIFTNATLDCSMLESRWRELAALDCGVAIALSDVRGPEGKRDHPLLVAAGSPLERRVDSRVSESIYSVRTQMLAFALHVLGLCDLGGAASESMRARHTNLE